MSVQCERSGRALDSQAGRLPTALQLLASVGEAARRASGVPAYVGSDIRESPARAIMFPADISAS